MNAAKSRDTPMVGFYSDACSEEDWSNAVFKFGFSVFVTQVAVWLHENGINECTDVRISDRKTVSNYILFAALTQLGTRVTIDSGFQPNCASELAKSEVIMSSPKSAMNPPTARQIFLKYLNRLLEKKALALIQGSQSPAKPPPIAEKMCQPVNEEHERNIISVSHPYKPSSRKVIFLTGATGFLGQHLLNEILTSSAHSVHCLVRSDSDIAAAERLLSHPKNRLLRKFLGSRLFVHAGSLVTDTLFQSVDTRIKLEQEIDTVIHCAANVNHIADFETLHNENVEAVWRIIQFAAKGKTKSIHFMSTLSTVIPDEHGVLHERFLSESDPLPSGGYARSKRAAEILLTRAQKAGLPVILYRPGQILDCDPCFAEHFKTNHFVARLRDSGSIGATYHDQSKIPCIDVRGLAKFCVSKLIYDEKSEVFHTVLPDSPSWNEIFQRTDLTDAEIKILDKREWEARLYQSMTSRSGLFPFLRHYLPYQSCPAARTINLEESSRKFLTENKKMKLKLAQRRYLMNILKNLADSSKVTKEAASWHI